MNRISTTMAALMLGAGLGGAAYAGDSQSNADFKDPSNTTQTAGQETADMSQNQHRSGPVLYERTASPEPHVQLPSGSHDSGVVAPGQPDSNSIAASGAASESPAGASGSGTSDQRVAGGVRDWAQIDANDDNLIQPEEMETWLQKEGPQAAAARRDASTG